MRLHSFSLQRQIDKDGQRVPVVKSCPSDADEDSLAKYDLYRDQQSDIPTLYDGADNRAVDEWLRQETLFSKPLLWCDLVYGKDEQHWFLAAKDGRQLKLIEKSNGTSVSKHKSKGGQAARLSRCRIGECHAGAQKTASERSA